MQRVTKGSTPKPKCVVQGDAINWPRQARQKSNGVRNEHDWKHPADIDFETGAHLHRIAERVAEGHGGQLMEHQFCAAGTVDREASAGGKTQRNA